MMQYAFLFQSIITNMRYLKYDIYWISNSKNMFMLTIRNVRNMNVR